MEKYTVEFDTGEEIEVEENQTILDACIEQGISHECSCRVGMCLSCIGKIVEGEVRQPGARGLNNKDRNEYVLTCMARPKSDLVIEKGEYPMV